MTEIINSFPGYKFDPFVPQDKRSTYRGEYPGEGGYVWAEPGMYENVALLDVASMHPTSIINLNLFGPYTKNYKDLLEARLAIKSRNYDLAKTLLGGKLEPFLQDQADAEALGYALKIALNIVFGLTAASFDNPFRDKRNVDNIVAKRGALFMVDLKLAVQEKGFQVIHIKTDSIKIPNATSEIIEFITDFGKKYGYDFEHEATYEKFCLTTKADYVAKSGGKWTAVGATFQHPYVFKTLFSDEVPAFDDFCESKNVKDAAMYLDFSETGDISQMVHVGRTGSFVPVETNGGDLWRAKDGKLHAVTGTKSYKWITRDMAASRMADDILEINMKYFDDLVDKASQAMLKYSPTGNIKDFVAS